MIWARRKRAKASFGNNVDTNGDIENALSIILCTRKLASNFDCSAKTAIKLEKRRAVKIEF